MSVSIIFNEKRPRNFWTKIGNSGYSAVMPTEFHDFFSLKMNRVLISHSQGIQAAKALWLEFPVFVQKL